MAPLIRGLSPDLDEAGMTLLRNVVTDFLDEHEPTRRRAIAAAITEAYGTLSGEGRRQFLQLLARNFWTDRQCIDDNVLTVQSTSDDAVRRDAEQELRLALIPPAAHVLRSFSLGGRGLMSLLDLRSDLLQLIDDEPVLAALDEELQMYLSTVLGVEMLTVERISWDSPGSLLERVMQHEAVHAIRSWPDLKIRLSSGRRCYALFHVSMVGEPLVLVQLALTSGIVKSLPKLLSNTEDDIRPTRCDTAVFYSISTCHAGLVGMNLARWLIKRAIEELTMDEPDIHRFVTLSPIKGFRRWAEEELGVDELTKRGGSLLPTRENIRPAGGGSFKQDESSHAELLALCARYITTCNDGRSLDPVANFHLANGALLGSVNWRADPSTTGLEQSLGMMASYVYELDRVAERAEAYRTRGVIAVSQELRELLGLPPLRHQETPAERDAGGHYEL